MKASVIEILPIDLDSNHKNIIHSYGLTRIGGNRIEWYLKKDFVNGIKGMIWASNCLRYAV
jgi:hypothetical protein